MPAGQVAARDLAKPAATQMTLDLVLDAVVGDLAQAPVKRGAVGLNDQRVPAQQRPRESALWTTYRQALQVRASGHRIATPEEHGESGCDGVAFADATHAEPGPRRGAGFARSSVERRSWSLPIGVWSSRPPADACEQIARERLSAPAAVRAVRPGRCRRSASGCDSYRRCVRENLSQAY